MNSAPRTLAEEHLTKFVKFLGHERFAVKSVRTGEKGAQEAHFDLLTVNKAVDYIKMRNGKRQLWVNVQRIKKDSKRYHDHHDVEAYTNIFIDIDAKKPDNKKDYAATKSERGIAVAQLPTVQRWLSENGFKQGLGFNSGNGAGLLLPIPPTPPTPEFIAKVAAFLKMVRTEANVDADTTTFDPPRVCGILGTWNSKLEDEDEGRKNHVREVIGEIPTRDEDDRLLEYIERLDPDPDALKTWIEKINGTASEPNNERVFDEDIPDDDPVDPAFVEEKLNALLEADPTLQCLLDWTDEAKTRHDGDRSDAEFGLVGKLTAAGFTDPQINWVMTHVSKIGKWSEEGEHYQKLTLQKIRAKDAEDSTGRKTPITREELDTMKVTEGPKFVNKLPPDHFITRFMKYGDDISDAYPEYWYGGSLHILSVLADKKLRIKLRQMTVWTNLYIMMSGKSSSSRKTTVVDVVEDILRRVKPDISSSMVPTEFSPEAFVEHMDANNHAPWIRDEAAGVLESMQKTYMAGFKDAMMQLYDCKPYYRKLRTSAKKSTKTEFNVDDPYLNLLWATTDTALAKNTTTNDTLSGFMARFLYHFPQRKRDKWLPLEEGNALNSTLETVVLTQLHSINKTIMELGDGTGQQELDGEEPGLMHLSKEAAEFWIDWQRKREAEAEATNDGDVMQIYSRLAPTVAKLAIIFELGAQDFDPKKPIRLEFVVEACRQVDEYYMPTAKAVYETVGADSEKNVIDKIIQYLKKHNGHATRREISRHAKIKAKDLEEYLGTMLGDGTVEEREVQGDTGRPSNCIILRA